MDATIIDKAIDLHFIVLMDRQLNRHWSLEFKQDDRETALKIVQTINHKGV